MTRKIFSAYRQKLTLVSVLVWCMVFLPTLAFAEGATVIIDPDHGGTAKGTKTTVASSIDTGTALTVETQSKKPSIFSDISGHWAEDPIMALALNGITGGYGDGTFRPEHTATRGEVAAFLARVIEPAFRLPR